MAHWIHHVPLVVIDTETTGLSWHRDGIAELAAVLLDGGVVTAEHVWLIDPGVPFSPEAVAASGLTAAMVHGRPTFAEVACDAMEMLAGRHPVAYNEVFDRSFLQGHVRRCLSPELERIFRERVPALRYEVDWVDVLVWARELLGGLPDRKLGTVAAHLGVPLVNQHCALADAKRAAEILIRLADRIPDDFDVMMAAQKAANSRQAAVRARRDW